MFIAILVLLSLLVVDKILGAAADSWKNKMEKESVIKNEDNW